MEGRITKRIIVLDIGTHKAQEARLVSDRSIRFSAKILLDLVKHCRGKPATFRDFKEIQTARKQLREIEFAYCFVEPILYQETLRALKFLENFVFIRGICSEHSSGPEVLRLAANSLGHSIIPTKPNLTAGKLRTWNFNFSNLLDWVNSNMRHTDQDTLILRMNAEGVEKEIVEALKRLGSSRHRVVAIYGSLGDVRKCFGAEALENTELQLHEMGIPFVQFTSNPGSWSAAMQQLCRLCSMPSSGDNSATRISEILSSHAGAARRP